MKNRELQDLLGGWPTAQPIVGFADRVMAACVAPTRQPTRQTIRQIARQPRRARGRVRSLLAIAALVAATVLVPLMIAHNAQSSTAPTVASAATAFDLGPQQD